MAPLISNSHKYSTLANDESETSSFIHNSEKTSPQYGFENKTLKSKFRALLPWLLHLSFFLAYVTFYVTWGRPTNIREAFYSPSDAPIEYETVQFHSNTANDTTPYQGPSTPETDAAWGQLLDLGPGLIWIDDETAEKLPQNTTRKFNEKGHEEESYVGVIEMFHQLHCLNRIRVQFYDHTRNDEYERPEVYKAHTEHCFDYLRQSLMCHGDLNIMSMNWIAEENMYTAQFDVIKQCRNFDIIKDWTKQHQTGWWPGHPSG